MENKIFDLRKIIQSTALNTHPIENSSSALRNDVVSSSESEKKLLDPTDNSLHSPNTDVLTQASQNKTAPPPPPPPNNSQNICILPNNSSSRTIPPPPPNNNQNISPHIFVYIINIKL